MNNGRPTDYTDGLAASICEQVADGQSLKAVCGKDEMPARSTVYLWLRDKQGFSDMYVRAKEECADLIFDEILEISDQYDKAAEKLEGGTDHIQRAKLRIDARKWVAGKLRPKAYGDKIVNEHTGKDGGPIEFDSPRERIASKLTSLTSPKQT